MHILFSQQSAYQHVQIVESQAGVVDLILDGVFQTTLPNDSYYATLLGPNNGLSTLILGGGDLTAVPELHRRKIKDWRLVEIDPLVVDACTPFCKVKRTLWQDHVTIGDAFAYLESIKPGEFEHIVVDLLSVEDIGKLKSMTVAAFLDLVTDRAGRYVSGFISAGGSGMAWSTLLQAAFFKRHFKFYSTLLNSEVGEVYFWAGRERVEFDPWTIRQVVAYPFGVRDPDLATLAEKEAALVIAEAL